MDNSNVNVNKVKPSGEEDLNLDPDMDLNISEQDLQNETARSMAKEDGEADEGNEEDTETRENRFRVYVDNFMNGDPYGVFIEQFIGVLSVSSCLAFLVLSYTDWSTVDECCIGFHKELEVYFTNFPLVNPTYGDDGYEGPDMYPITQILDECDPKCNQFYHSRMPRIYEYFDQVVCMVYLINYSIVIYIS